MRIAYRSLFLSLYAFKFDYQYPPIENYINYIMRNISWEAHQIAKELFTSTDELPSFNFSLSKKKKKKNKTSNYGNDIVNTNNIKDHWN